jgi:demethylmenaquinone methyltransferase/2-methoxy-6-polyprenyl-1,4-benzoquinol methylase
MPDPQRVQNMFDRIAGRYDLLNRVMTMGIDKRWRKAAVRATGARSGSKVLDVCCGTGDLTFLLARAGADVIGADFSENKLAQARLRVGKQPVAIANRVQFQQGDAMALPFADDTFDALTVSFGVRNVASLDTAFAEFHRVVRPGGTVVCLEITRPRRFPFTLFYKVWFDRVVPVVGRLLSGDAEAYSYLPESTLAFPQPKVLAESLRGLGYDSVGFRTFAGGIVALHTALVRGVACVVRRRARERAAVGAPTAAASNGSHE